MKGLLYTYLATYLGGAVAVFYPLVGLYLFINFAIIQPSSMWYWQEMPGHCSEILGGGMLIGWALKGFGDWRFGRGTAVAMAIVGFLGWAVLCTAVSDAPAVGWGFVVAIFKIVLPFLVGLTLIDTPQKLRILLWVLALSQGYVAFELNLSYYAGINRLVVEGFGGMDNNFVAVAMVAGTGLAFFLGLGERRLWLKGVAFLAAILMTHAVMFSFSRGGLLALIITGGVAFLLVAKKPTHVLIFVLAVVFAFRLAGPQVRERFSSTFVDAEQRDRSASSRLEFWSACWDVMKKEPLCGVGPDQWLNVAEAYGFGRTYAHSLWMQTGAEMGFPGLGLLLAFYGITLWRLFPLTRSKSQVVDPWLRDVARMVIASLLGFMVAAQFVSISGLELPYYIVLAGVIALKLNSVPAGEPVRVTNG
jgi:probable O-glycosylation ligase (exosortase A-associated)